MGEPQNGWFIVEKVFFIWMKWGTVTTMTSESSETIHGSARIVTLGCYYLANSELRGSLETSTGHG
jgi:hypothetical protein